MVSKDSKLPIIFMKRIRSNPYGFGIHSPYGYHLVARVLFGRSSLTATEKLLLSGHSRHERKTARRIVRLAGFLNPACVVLPSRDDTLVTLLSEWLPLILPATPIGRGVDPGTPQQPSAEGRHASPQDHHAPTDGRHASPQDHHAPTEGNGGVLPGHVTMIIGSVPADFPDGIPDDPFPASWILSGLQDLELLRFFNILRHSEKATFTLEVDNTGIVIFDPKLMKHDYFVREWFRF